jgi:acetylglutamate kinase
MIRHGIPQDLTKYQNKAHVLVEAFPYLNRFRGRIVVIKVGGEILLDQQGAENFARNIALLNSVGIKVVVCHGGGPQISSLMRELGKEPTFLEGQRITCRDTLEITSMVLLGQVNRKLVSLVNKFGSQAVGLSGVDGNILQVRKLDERLGYVGSVELVRCEPIQMLLAGGYIPILSSLGSDGKGESYNVNADIAAGEVARSLHAEKLVVLTNTEGLYENFDQKQGLISEIDLSSLQTLKEQGAFSAGMIPKIDSVITALQGGVSTAHILDGRTDNVLLLEIFTQQGIGTMIFP